MRSLKLSPRNARTHTKKQLQQIAKSIERFGFINPILIDEKKRIVAGHGRVEAAKLLGMDKVPTICLAHLSEAELRAYALADNKIAENAGWDPDLVAAELQYLSELEIDLDLTITGFETAEIDIALGDGPEEGDAPVPEPDRNTPAVTRSGDLWRIGNHRLLCGDARDERSYNRLMDGKKAQLVFIDPPYNVPINGNVCGRGAIKHAEFAMASGELSRDEYAGFLRTVFGHLVAFSANGSIHFICIDWRHLETLLLEGNAAYTEFLNLCVWNKTNAGMGSLYRSKHEEILVYKNGTGSHINNIELGRHGRYRTNVWDYPGVNSFGKDRDDLLAAHPTVKPLALVADAIKDCSKRGGIVLDAFAGSGTTLLAAHKTGRVGYALEIDPYYVDTALVRMQDSTGFDALHAESALTFSQMKSSCLKS